MIGDRPEAERDRFRESSSVCGHLCKRLCEMVPQHKRSSSVFPMLEYAGIDEDFDFWLGKRMLLAGLLGVIGFLIPLTVGKYFGFLDFESNLLVFSLSAEQAIAVPVIPLLASIALGVSFVIVIALLFYLHLYYTVEGRAELVEAILPDFLLLVASNVNSGMTPFAAFRSSARKEFGPLSDEIKVATARSLGTESFQHALKELSKRIRSSSLEETVSFFSQALRSGGRLSRLLESTADDLRQTAEMRKELVSSTKMYIIFVGFVVTVGAPLLLAIGIQFLRMISSIQSESGFTGDEFATIGFLSAELNITPEFMVFMAYVLLLGNALLSSLFIGVLTRGKTKMGLKYFPVILVASVIVFQISLVFLGGFLGV